jgi:hypothetical protein
MEAPDMVDRQNLRARRPGCGRRVRTIPAISGRFVACPTCGEWLDSKDLAQLVRHAEVEHASPTLH